MPWINCKGEKKRTSRMRKHSEHCIHVEWKRRRKSRRWRKKNWEGKKIYIRGVEWDKLIPLLYYPSKYLMNSLKLFTVLHLQCNLYLCFFFFSCIGRRFFFSKLALFISIHFDGVKNAPFKCERKVEERDKSFEVCSLDYSGTLTHFVITCASDTKVTYCGMVKDECMWT